MKEKLILKDRKLKNAKLSSSSRVLHTTILNTYWIYELCELLQRLWHDHNIINMLQVLLLLLDIQVYTATAPVLTMLPHVPSSKHTLVVHFCVWWCWVERNSWSFGVAGHICITVALWTTRTLSALWRTLTSLHFPWSSFTNLLSLAATVTMLLIRCSD